MANKYGITVNIDIKNRIISCILIWSKISVFLRKSVWNMKSPDRRVIKPRPVIIPLQPVIRLQLLAVV